MTPPTGTTAGAAPLAAPAVVRHGSVLGICLGGHHERDADVVLIGLAAHLEAAGLTRVTAMTHFVAVGDGRGVGCSITCTGDPGALWTLARESVAPSGALCLGTREHGGADLLVGAGAAAAAAEFAHSGRAVVFPGSDRVTGTMLVTELVTASAVDLVTVVGRGAADPDDVVDTRGHVRPVLRDGRLVLATRPAVGGVLVPAEVADPTPCCATHG